jgi:hypothetical protein
MWRWTVIHYLCSILFRNTKAPLAAPMWRPRVCEPDGTEFRNMVIGFSLTKYRWFVLWVQKRIDPYQDA